MKQFVALIICIMMFISMNTYAETKTLGIQTETLLTMFENYMVPFGISTYPMELREKDKGKDSIIVLFTKYCTLHIRQENGVVKSFQIVASEDDGSNQRIDEIMASFLGGIMLIDLGISSDDAIAFLTTIANTGEEKELNGISYRVITGQPFTTVISLEVKPVE